jgi:hypothetical protein
MPLQQPRHIPDKHVCDIVPPPISSGHRTVERRSHITPYITLPASKQRQDAGESQPAASAWAGSAKCFPRLRFGLRVEAGES